MDSRPAIGPLQIVGRLLAGPLPLVQVPLRELRSLMSSRSTACAAIGRSALVESGGRPNPASGPGGEGIALYLHIPFCLSKCPYCDFNTYEGIETLMGGYIAALAREIALWGGLLKQPRVTSIYFGGGTPSYIPPGSIDSTMAAVHEAFDVLPDAEISMEANPGDITPERVESWRSSGINRMSIGVQSFDDGLLKSLGQASQFRTGGGSSARREVPRIRELQFRPDVRAAQSNPRPLAAIPRTVHRTRPQAHVALWPFPGTWHSS